MLIARQAIQRVFRFVLRSSKRSSFLPNSYFVDLISSLGCCYLKHLNVKIEVVLRMFVFVLFQMIGGAEAIEAFQTYKQPSFSFLNNLIVYWTIKALRALVFVNVLPLN